MSVTVGVMCLGCGGRKLLVRGLLQGVAVMQNFLYGRTKCFYLPLRNSLYKFRFIGMKLVVKFKAERDSILG